MQGAREVSVSVRDLRIADDGSWPPKKFKRSGEAGTGGGDDAQSS